MRPACTNKRTAGGETIHRTRNFKEMLYGCREIYTVWVWVQYGYVPCMKITSGNFTALNELDGFNSITPKGKPANEKEIDR